MFMEKGGPSLRGNQRMACPALFDNPLGHTRGCPLATLNLLIVLSAEGPTAMTRSISNKTAVARCSGLTVTSTVSPSSCGSTSARCPQSTGNK
jgi:hypothetical protein